LKRLLLATTNRGKLREFSAALEQEGIEVVGLDTLPNPPDVEETGDTFEVNARIKAEAYSLLTDLPVIADDSGLEVDALHGEPGVRSARYGGPDLDDPGRCRKVLENLEGVPAAERTARFRCALALARSGRTLATYEGTAEGRILEAPRGENGFGYDPVFFHEEAGRTFGEITREHKQRLSHRGAAIRALLDAIRAGDAGI
jgi:XTP/dITP diphosphohydrolase